MLCDICPICRKNVNLTDEHIEECKVQQVKHLENVLLRTLTDEEKESLWS